MNYNKLPFYKKLYKQIRKSEIEDISKKGFILKDLDVFEKYINMIVKFSYFTYCIIIIIGLLTLIFF